MDLLLLYFKNKIINYLKFYNFLFTRSNHLISKIMKCEYIKIYCKIVFDDHLKIPIMIIKILLTIKFLLKIN